jgi:hypothetical protein
MISDTYMPSTFIYFDFSHTKIVLLKTVRSLKIFQRTTFRSPTLIGASFASISAVLTYHFGLIIATGLRSTV